MNNRVKDPLPGGTDERARDPDSTTGRPNGGVPAQAVTCKGEGRHPSPVNSRLCDTCDQPYDANFLGGGLCPSCCHERGREPAILQERAPRDLWP